MFGYFHVMSVVSIVKYVSPDGFYTVSQKKQATKLLSITLPNIGRFFKILSLLDSVGNL